MSFFGLSFHIILLSLRKTELYLMEKFVKEGKNEKKMSQNLKKLGRKML